MYLLCYLIEDIGFQYFRQSLISEIDNMKIKNLAKPSEVFKDRLRAARENLRQMTQVDLARAIGLPPSSIAHFESGSRKPSFDNLRKIANALNVTTDYLVGRADDPNTTASADPIYRHVANLTDQNRRTAEDFLRFLAEQDRRQREGDRR